MQVAAPLPPFTSNSAPGEDVPTPTDPFEVITNGEVSPVTSLTTKQFPVPS